MKLHGLKSVVSLYFKLHLSGTILWYSAGQVSYPLTKASGFSKIFRHIKKLPLTGSFCIHIRTRQHYSAC